MENPFQQLEKRLAGIENKLAAIASRPARYLTIDQTCELLSVTRPTLWAWNKKGILESIRIGNLRRYRMSDIEALAAKQLDKTDKE
jgi:excisionase family DNA binding protein